MVKQNWQVSNELRQAPTPGGAFNWEQVHQQSLNFTSLSGSENLTYTIPQGNNVFRLVHETHGASRTFSAAEIGNDPINVLDNFSGTASRVDAIGRLSVAKPLNQIQLRTSHLGAGTTGANSFNGNMTLYRLVQS